MAPRGQRSIILSSARLARPLMCSMCCIAQWAHPLPPAPAPRPRGAASGPAVVLSPPRAAGARYAQPWNRHRPAGSPVAPSMSARSLGAYSARNLRDPLSRMRIPGKERLKNRGDCRPRARALYHSALMRYLLALDQGTTSSRALLFDERAALLCMARARRLRARDGAIGDHQPAGERAAARERHRLAGPPAPRRTASGCGRWGSSPWSGTRPASSSTPISAPPSSPGCSLSSPARAAAPTARSSAPGEDEGRSGAGSDRCGRSDSTIRRTRRSQTACIAHSGFS